MATIAPDPNLGPTSMPWARWATTEVQALRAALDRLGLDGNNNAQQLSTSIGVLADTVARGAGSTYTKAESDALLASGLSGKSNVGHTHAPSDISAGTFPAGNFTMPGSLSLGGDLFVPNAFTASVSWTSAYINGDGRLTKGASSRRFKENIQNFTPSMQAVLAMQVMTYRFKPEYLGGNGIGELEVGVMAEDLHDLGLRWLVSYDEAFRPESVRYDRIALAILPLVQHHEDRIAALEATIADIEARLAP